jgi:hypothetical protein
LLDCPDKSWDKKISTYLLKEAIKGDDDDDNNGEGDDDNNTSNNNNTINNNNNNNNNNINNDNNNDNEFESNRDRSIRLIENDIWNIDTIKVCIHLTIFLSI